MHSPKIIYLFWLIYLTPLAITIATVDGKPIDIVPSDFLLILIPIIMLKVDSLSPRHWNAIAILSYFPMIGLVGAFRAGGDVGNILSAVTFSMPFFHILIGGMAIHRWGHHALEPLQVVASFVAIILALSDLTLGSFPRGCGTEGRWGGCFLNFEVYGFVNSSSGYLVILAGILACSVFIANSRLKMALTLIGLGALLFIVPMSLSRSATVSLFIVLFFWTFSINRTLSVVFLLIAGMTMQFILPLLEDSLIGRGLTTRVLAGVDRGDLASGRFEIWRDTISLIGDAPIFGYMFGFFSRYSYFGTAHSQYLELLFKAGAVGLIIYLGFIFYCASRANRIFKAVDLDPRISITALGTFVALMANSVTQPLMNYAVFANLMFLAAGMIMAVPLRARQ